MTARTMLRRFSHLIVIVGMTSAGAVVLQRAFTVAAEQPEALHARYGLFWLGFATLLAPWVRLAWVNRTSNRWLSSAALFAAGGLTWVPRYLRGPDGPVSYDEYLHYGQFLRVADQFGTFPVQNSVVEAIGYYPGLHYSAWALNFVVPSTWWALAIPVVVAHASMPVAVAAIARGARLSPQVATGSGLLYLFVPGYLYFNSQVAYQSLALPIAAWITAAVVRSRHGLRIWQFTGLLVGGVVVVLTHHVTGMFLSVVVLGAGLYARFVFRSGYRKPFRILALGAALVMFSVAYAVFVARGVIGYLVPEGVRLSDVLARISPTGDGSRQAFSTAGIPGYEIAVGYLAPVIFAGLLAGGIWVRFRRCVRGLVYDLGILAGSLYALSVPLVRLPSGATWAHRSWPFLWVLAAPVAVTGGLFVAKQISRLARPLTVVVVGVMVCVLAVGNVATEVNDQYRFPGPPMLGADTRPAPEIVDLVTWFATNAAGDRVASDPDVRNRLYAVGKADVVRSYPEYNLFFAWPIDGAFDLVTREEVFQAAAFGIEWMVLDSRMETELPARGFYFAQHEPGAFDHERGLGRGLGAKLASEPWLHEEAVFGPYRVYRLLPGCIAYGADAAVLQARIDKHFSREVQDRWGVRTAREVLAQTCPSTQITAALEEQAEPTEVYGAIPR